MVKKFEIFQKIQKSLKKSQRFHGFQKNSYQIKKI